MRFFEEQIRRNTQAACGLRVTTDMFGFVTHPGWESIEEAPIDHDTGDTGARNQTKILKLIV